ncbi:MULTISPECIES: NADPH-dependent F420 reductase [unclassified Halorhabdus]|uniref:NADPH-dependent F420 reductase n=1 Tax=unclassified Halorhabdus TaxID=2621901 RepID=UPI0023DBF198|nr:MULTISPECIES: NADPH-dependent F420 reductase [unclassified Halorhabdus]WEL17432.1 NADPH-dependent F420 reductase [Halorhabdus sp. SVX81]WEL21310.1 NADPH-dependent F420 reductase [Halorhabdus sp. BNX81]
MRIAILGGTGDIGEGLALRWAYHTSHDVVIGSRDAQRARSKADEYETELSSRGEERTISAAANVEAAADADVVVAAVPAYHLVDTIEQVSDGLDAETVLVSPAVGMQRDESGMHYNRPGAGSVTALAAEAAPEDVPVVGAFHNLAADELANLDIELSLDAILIGDDEDALERVEVLTDGIDGLRPLRAGPIDNAAEVESLTPLLINLAMYNDDLQDVGVRFE